LEAAGYEVTEAANGRQGLELYRLRPTALVITDILMPELSGLDMLLELTREFLNAKVIAISGAGGGKNVLDVAKLLGARQTFEKPFSLPHLLAAVRYELEH
jgi:two-component system response regulator (stage 0 sporulation protein F)